MVTERDTIAETSSSHEGVMILPLLTVGGALEKWPNFKNALMVLRTGNKLVMVFVMMCMNFERKKLSGRSSYYG